ncbi:MAG: glycosyltransferase family 2 protein [Clostridiaceae bacterium]|nr:glycosyltransferase family 2 protein [Clostridiaceae bacterium]
MKKISILVPVYNEEDVLNEFYNVLTEVIDSLNAYQFEILFVDDGSTDNSINIIKTLRAKDARVSYVKLSRNFGKEIALIAGMDYIAGDAVIIMDADLQHRPEIIPELIEYWNEGYDDVYIKREKREGESFFKKTTSTLYYKLLQKMTNVSVLENAGDFRLLDRRCVNALKKMRESQRYTKGLYSLIGYKKKPVIYSTAPRAAGKTKWNYVKLIDLAVDGITSFSIYPLRLASITGIIVSFCSFIYMAVVIFKKLCFGEVVRGYPTIVSLILFLGGIQLICLGVIGEYIGRIFYETKQRPLYFVDEYNDKKEMNT